MNAGFAKTDITPGVPCVKAGWLRIVNADRVADPLFARAAAFEGDGGWVALVVLDVLSLRYARDAEIRRRAAAASGIPPERIMVAATHNHAGPAVVRAGDVRRDEPYLDRMVARAAEAVAAAKAAAGPVRLAVGTAEEPTVGRNRRVLHRDGLVRTHGSLKAPGAVGLEGPADPRVTVLAARNGSGTPVGLLVHYACHPTHHGGDGIITAGWPGALCRAIEADGWPLAVFVQGALGDVSTQDPGGEPEPDIEEAGARLAAAALAAVGRAQPVSSAAVASSAETVTLPYRAAGPEEVAGTVRGAQRFIDPAIYDREIPRFLEKIRGRPGCPATVRALNLGGVLIPGIPAELFVAFALDIKRRLAPAPAIVAGLANGMVGYVPTREAFRHGGYETTFCPGSHLAPEAGDLLAAAAVRTALAAAG